MVFVYTHHLICVIWDLKGYYIYYCISYLLKNIECKQADIEMTYNKVSKNKLSLKIPLGGGSVSISCPWTNEICGRSVIRLTAYRGPLPKSTTYTTRTSTNVGNQMK